MGLRAAVLEARLIVLHPAARLERREQPPEFGDRLVARVGLCAAHRFHRSRVLVHQPLEGPRQLVLLRQEPFQPGNQPADVLFGLTCDHIGLPASFRQRELRFGERFRSLLLGRRHVLVGLPARGLQFRRGLVPCRRYERRGLPARIFQYRVRAPLRLSGRLHGLLLGRRHVLVGLPPRSLQFRRGLVPCRRYERRGLPARIFQYRLRTPLRLIGYVHGLPLRRSHGLRGLTGLASSAIEDEVGLVAHLGEFLLRQPFGGGDRALGALLGVPQRGDRRRLCILARALGLRSSRREGLLGRGPAGAKDRPGARGRVGHELLRGRRLRSIRREPSIPGGISVRLQCLHGFARLPEGVTKRRPLTEPRRDVAVYRVERRRRFVEPSNQRVAIHADTSRKGLSKGSCAQDSERPDAGTPGDRWTGQLSGSLGARRPCVRWRGVLGNIMRETWRGRSGRHRRMRLMEEARVATCCIAGCGPAGAILGLLLARSGVDVVVLEKHGDFLRDFRGDTIHPSTLDILDDLGLAERFLALPHSRVERFTLRTTAGETLSFGFEGVAAKFPFVAFVPQWDFLNFVTAEARRYPTFALRMNADVVGLIEEDGRVCGVRYRTETGEGSLRAGLTVGADGRSSRTREAAALPQTATSPPMDVLWFRLPRNANDPGDAQGIVGPGHFVALFDRGKYWQIAYLISKGGLDAVRVAGLQEFQASVASLVPMLADRVGELTNWDQIKLLTVRSDRLTRWYRPGYLAIGDAAHAMSPVGGVGINVAIQDAVAAANVLWRPLLNGPVTTADLAAVQRRREVPVRVTQSLQAFMQRQLLVPALAHGRPPRISPVARAALAAPGLRTLLPSLLGFGLFRPHVESPARLAAAP